MSAKNQTLKKIAVAGLMSALSLVLIAVIRIPIIPSAPWLVLDGGDIPILMSGFLLGPWWGLLVTVVASLIQALVFSSDGIIGGLMHILASGAFVVVSGLIYQKWKTFKGALVGLLVGGLTMVAVVIPANIYITPLLYTNMTPEMVLPLIPTAILPFNAIKAAVNTVLVLLIYKPISRALKKIHWL